MTTENFTWTEANIDLLKRLWSEGATSRECGLILGISRNAVLGKVHRLDLAERAPSPPRFKVLKSGLKIKRIPKPQKQIPQVAPLVALIIAKPRPAAPKSAKLSLLDLTNETCRWPQGHSNFTFCSHSPRAGSSYCEYHFKLGFLPLKRSSSSEQRAHMMVNSL
jgi:GcrA cell cycle regulator